MCSTPSAPTKRGRRWFQFSLRGFLLLMLVAGVAVGWLGRIYMARWEKRKVAARIWPALCRADFYLPHSDDGTGGLSFGRPSQIGDRELVYIAELSKLGYQLEGLDLHLTRITDAGLAHLKHLDKLQQLDLSETGITDAGLEHVRELRGLRILELHSTRITSDGLQRLTSLRQLEYLWLPAGVTPETLQKLREALPDCNIQ